MLLEFFKLYKQNCFNHLKENNLKINYINVITYNFIIIFGIGGILLISLILLLSI
jgi:hypothetical protein